jgi:hypothetical protein
VTVGGRVTSGPSTPFDLTECAGGAAPTRSPATADAVTFTRRVRRETQPQRVVNQQRADHSKEKTMKSLTKTAFAIAASGALTLTAVSAAGTSAGATSEPPPDTTEETAPSAYTAFNPTVMLVHTDGRALPIDSPQAQTILAGLANNGHIPTPTKTADGPGISNQPMWTVGVGWRIYLYLNHGDIDYIGGLSSTIGSAVICGMITKNLAAGVVCAGLGYIIWERIQNEYKPYPPGACMEASFTYAGTDPQFKWVARNC